MISNTILSAEHYDFISPTKGRLFLGSVIDEVLNYFREDEKAQYKIIIGTDSNSNGEPEFVTAIVILRIGRGGRYFYRKRNGLKIASLRHKIHTEVNYSLETANEVVVALRDRLGELKLNYQPEIHIDVGENGPTKDIIKEVVNIVLSNGFKVRYKPDSYVATTIADRYT